MEWIDWKKIGQTDILLYKNEKKGGEGSTKKEKKKKKKRRYEVKRQLLL